MMTLRMRDDPFFDDKHILLIDQNLNKGNDRTWSFWQKESTMVDHLISASWRTIKVTGQEGEQHIALDPYRYVTIEGADFYAAAFAKIKEATNITLLEASVENIIEGDSGIIVKTSQGNYDTSQVLNSLFDREVLCRQKKYAVLQQHFVGWFIQTAQARFDPEVATFMDFNIPQRGNCRFMYVLPTSSTEALFEYTLFSEDLLPEAEYEAAIKDYLKEQGVTAYTITRKERGSIPMTCYPFEQHNTARMIHIGTAGGWTRPSTGYTFSYALKRSAVLVAFLKTGQDFSTFSKRSRFWYFDLLLLDVLQRNNGIGGQIFTTLFRRNPVDRLFRFLDEESSLWDELRIVLTPPPMEFIRAFFRKVFNK